MGIIADEWQSYRDNVLPKDAMPIQVSETRRAFYAGFCSLFSVLLKKVEPGEEPTDKDMRMMDSIKAELDQHLQEARSEAKRHVGRG